VNRSEEHALIRRAATGDHAAAEALIRAHQASLYGYLLRMCARSDLAEDMVQDAFVRVLANLDRFDPRFRFSTWLFTIGRRLLVNQLQKLRPTADTDTLGRAPAGAAGPDARAGQTEESSHLHDALQRALLALPEVQREVLILFHQLDWPIALIAQHMDMPEGTVKSHLHRGRRKMRVLLEANKNSAHHPPVGEAVA
jgi:RNA polymerase sigma-70 factor, ECF subfamily